MPATLHRILCQNLTMFSAIMDWHQQLLLPPTAFPQHNHTDVIGKDTKMH